MNLLIVFLTTGLWHGASWNFILWGLFHGMLSVIERLGFRKILDRHKIFAHIYTLGAVIFGWVLFRAESLVQAGVFIRRMLLPWEYKATSVKLPLLIGNRTLTVIILGIMGAGAVQAVLQKISSAEKIKNSVFELLYCSCIMILCLALLASNTYNPFIYFRF